MNSNTNNANDYYVVAVVSQHTSTISYNVAQISQELNSHIYAWANGYRYELRLSGSVAKGTCIVGATDIDFFISLDPSVSTYNTLEQVYITLRNRFNGAGYTVREQNVSIGISHAGYKIDIVPGVKHHPLGLDHSIWKRKAQTWTKTNIDDHVQYVVESGRVFDIKAIKIWRELRGLDFPSFYLELSVIEALKGKFLLGNPSDKFVKVMNYLANEFVDKVITDPSNQTNFVSDELTNDEKDKIKHAAIITLNGNWKQAIW